MGESSVATAGWCQREPLETIRNHWELWKRVWYCTHMEPMNGYCWDLMLCEHVFWVVTKFVRCESADLWVQCHAPLKPGWAWLGCKVTILDYTIEIMPPKTVSSALFVQPSLHFPLGRGTLPTQRKLHTPRVLRCVFCRKPSSHRSVNETWETVTVGNMGWKPETILAGQVFGVTSPQEIQELALSSRYPPVISHMFLRCYRVNGPSIGVLCICISMACICI